MAADPAKQEDYSAFHTQMLMNLNLLKGAEFMLRKDTHFQLYYFVPFASKFIFGEKKQTTSEFRIL